MGQAGSRRSKYAGGAICVAKPNHGGGGGSRIIFPQDNILKINNLKDMQNSKNARIPARTYKSVQKSPFRTKSPQN
jgi:hypothetical protein